MPQRMAVFCGAAVGTDPAYTHAAIKLTQELYRLGYGLVFGGGRIGLMGVMADEMIRLGGETIGVIPELLVRKEVAHDALTQLIVVDTMHERKAKLFTLCDAIIILPGGIGTMDEFFEAITWNQLEIHQKPCGILNTNGFYTHFQSFIAHMSESGFLRTPVHQMYVMENEPDKLVERLHAQQESSGTT